jgi:RNA-directed DNA polymerase
VPCGTGIGKEDLLRSRVNHDKLMGQIAKRVEDKRLLKLIRAFLNAGVMENGLVSPSVEGTPQ